KRRAPFLHEPLKLLGDSVLAAKVNSCGFFSRFRAIKARPLFDPGVTNFLADRKWYFQNPCPYQVFCMFHSAFLKPLATSEVMSHSPLQDLCGPLHQFLAEFGAICCCNAGTFDKICENKGKAVVRAEAFIDIL